MQTKLLSANQPGAIDKAVALLLGGQLIAFPTDTLYGVGADVHDPTAIRRLYAAKDRPTDKGIPVLLSDAGQLLQVAASVPQVARDLADRFWPGPLTLILHRNPRLPAELTPGDNIAVRVPDNEIARRFIQAAGGAVATSSANRSGQAPALNALEALEALGHAIAAVIDGGPVRYAQASTIVDCTLSPPQLIRQGPLSPEELGLVKAAAT
jgi:L-threonylcarbamoyladenylate synthase